MGSYAKCMSSSENVCLPTKFPCSWDIFGNFLSQILETIWKTFSHPFPLKVFHWTESSFHIAFLHVHFHIQMCAQMPSHFSMKSTYWNVLTFEYPMRAFKTHGSFSKPICSAVYFNYTLSLWQVFEMDFLGPLCSPFPS